MRSTICFLLALMLIGPAMLIQAQPSGELVIALPNDPTSLYIANASDVTAISATRRGCEACSIRCSGSPAMGRFSPFLIL